MTITHFIPLIGPFELAARKLRAEGHDLDTKYLFSFDCMAPNESHLTYNFPELEIKYLKEDDFITKDTSIKAYQDYFREHEIAPTDFVLGVPPCAGLSMTNTGVNSGPLAPQNRFIYEAVKFWVAQESRCLIIENAPTLSSDRGRPVVKRMKEILDNNIPGQYAMHMVRTTTLHHGLPQDRRRTFLFIYRTTEKTHQVLTSPRYAPVSFDTYAADLGVNAVDHTLCEPSIYSKDPHDQWRELMTSRPDLMSEAIAEDKDRNFVELWPTLHRAWKSGNLDASRWPRIQQFFEHLSYKASIGRPGFYDAIMPYIAKYYTGSIMHKMMVRIVHPNMKRYLWMREVMCLMGYPKNFNLKGDPVKVFNHICQSIPITTAADAILWGVQLLTNDGLTRWGSTEDVFFQNNMQQQDKLMDRRDNCRRFSLEVDMKKTASRQLLF